MHAPRWQHCQRLNGGLAAVMHPGGGAVARGNRRNSLDIPESWHFSFIRWEGREVLAVGPALGLRPTYARRFLDTTAEREQDFGRDGETSEIPAGLPGSDRSPVPPGRNHRITFVEGKSFVQDRGPPVARTMTGASRFCRSNSRLPSSRAKATRLAMSIGSMSEASASMLFLVANSAAMSRSIA